MRGQKYEIEKPNRKVFNPLMFEFKTRLIIAITLGFGIIYSLGIYIFTLLQRIDTPYTYIISLMVVLVLIIDGLIGYVVIPLIIEQRRVEKIEEIFPGYIRDVVKAMRTGYPLPLALDYVVRVGDYGPFQKFAKKLAAKVSWGREFEDVILEVAALIKSKIIALSADIISSAAKSGGKVVDVLDAISNLIDTITTLEKRRKSSLKGFCFTVLVVYGAYLASMYILTYTFIPSFVKEYADEYLYIMFIIVVGQGFFCGILAGYIESMSWVGAIKWAMIYLLIATIGYGVVVVIKPPVDPAELIKLKIKRMTQPQEMEFNQTNITLFGAL